MIKRALVDTDIILDVALARTPFLESSKLVMAIFENYISIGHITSNEVTNIYYILRKVGGDKDARILISKLLQYLTVLSIDHSDIQNSLQSEFSDFEDGVQHFAALSNQCDCIVTRNVDDYRKSKIPVYSPIEFLSIFKELL